MERHAGEAAGGLPLFEGSLPPPAAGDEALRLLEHDLREWEALVRRISLPGRDGRRVSDLGRDLRALRDCYEVAHHPRVRRALLEEAGVVAGHMRALGRRLGMRRLDLRLAA